jgi:hypothetical protein
MAWFHISASSKFGSEPSLVHSLPDLHAAQELSVVMVMVHDGVHVGAVCTRTMMAGIGMGEEAAPVGGAGGVAQGTKRMEGGITHLVLSAGNSVLPGVGATE